MGRGDLSWVPLVSRGSRQRRARADDEVLLVKTEGNGSLDRYSQKLAEHLDVQTLRSDIYQRSAEVFNVPLLSAASLRALAADVQFVRELRRRNQLVHLPNHHLGRYGRFLSAPFVVTVHDLIRYFDAKGLGPFIHSPNVRDRACLRVDYSGISRAAAVIAVSNKTKQDLIEHLGLPEERIFVIYEGVDRVQFRPTEPAPVGHPYVLFVGSEHPRKNLRTLLHAFAALKRSPRFADLKLVKVGAAGGPEAPFREDTLSSVSELGLEGEVVFTERVRDDELPAYYSGARCLVLASFYEGFGLPPLEAMACGCPVIVSSAGALPEIAGDAALVIDPHDRKALADALRRVLEDESLRASLRQRGFERSKHFSWEEAARETAAVYDFVRRAGEAVRAPVRRRAPALGGGERY